MRSKARNHSIGASLIIPIASFGICRFDRKIGRTAEAEHRSVSSVERWGYRRRGETANLERLESMGCRHIMKPVSAIAFSKRIRDALDGRRMI
ncbi:MAG: hypothetical protein GY866_13300 [Proteobacteria bacterium]|nr:hypothetical protein [Pseudomonadota bacterium]